MKTLLYQISTHWDREWYRQFQGFRYYLVEMTDRLLDSLESGETPGFIFDGQTIVLDDYLEIRPENRARVEALVKSGRLRVGPWYCMPDELIVSGEALVENLLVGQNTARAYGSEPWRFGYICDMFGHAADMPQIFAGFGINGAFLGRGITRLPNGTFFRWRSPDGSECVVCKDNYANFKRSFDESADKAKFLSDRLADRDIAVINYTDDHAGIDEHTPEFVKCVRECGCELGGLDEFPALLEGRELPVISGELIETAHKPDFRAVTGSISSYYPLKKLNDETEAMLWRETAPLIVMGELCGILKGKRAFFDTARKYLLKNHPHDSMCGCSIDAVHMDMPYRFRQAQAIGDVISEEFRSKLKRTDGFGFTLINTDVHSREGVIIVDIDFPRGWKSVYTDNTGYQSYNLFKILDSAGNEREYQLLSIKRGVEVYNRQAATPVDRYRVALDAKLLPCGFTAFRVEPASTRNAIPPKSPEKAHAENEFLKLAIEPDGSLTLTDKATGRVFTGLHTFIDDGDSGNGWFHESAAFDEPKVLSTDAARIEVIHSGGLLTTFRVTKRLEVPSGLDKYRKNRAEEYQPLDIVSEIALRRGERLLRIHTSVDNRASEHRLRVVFPTGIEGGEYFASQGFGFVERKRGSSEEGYAGREPEFCEKNTSGIVGTEDFTFVGEGFHEGGVYPDGTISMTMFRSVGKMFHQPEAEYAKLLGKMEFDYAVAVGAAREELPDTFRKPIPADLLTDELSFMSVESREVRMSVLKPAESCEGYILRLFNPTDREIDAGFRCVYKVTEVRMDESGEKPFERKFRPYEIKTLLIRGSII